MYATNKPVKRAVWKDHKIIGYVSISLEDKDFLNGIQGGFYLGFTDEEHKTIREGGKFVNRGGSDAPAGQETEVKYI